MIRATELLLERGYGKLPAFHTNDPGQFRDVLETTDAQIRDRLGVIRGLLIEQVSIPWRCPTRNSQGWSPRPPGWLRRALLLSSTACTRHRF